MGKVGNYNYIDERERVIGKWCKMITSNTLEALQKETIAKSLEISIEEIDRIKAEK